MCLASQDIEFSDYCVDRPHTVLSKGRRKVVLVCVMKTYRRNIGMLPYTTTNAEHQH
jgi:hypothetical protein